MEGYFKKPSHFCHTRNEVIRTAFAFTFPTMGTDIGVLFTTAPRETA
jgi:hypothetical protein